MKDAWRWALGLFVAALLVRVAAAVVLGIGGAPVEDERDYVVLGRHLIDEGAFHTFEIFEGRVVGVREVVSFRTPLVPAVLAPVAAAGGDVTAMRWMSVLVGALAAPLAYLGLRRTSLGERARWVGAALCVWPPAVYLSLRVLSEPYAQALLLGALAVGPDPGDRVLPNRRSLVAGILAGLSILARPAGLIACLFLAFTRGGLRRAGWFAIGLVLVVAPWVARNWHLHGRPLLTTNTGVTLVGANSAAAATAAWPGKWLPPDQVYAGHADPPDLWMWGWSDLSEAESDRRFTRDALTWVRENPGDALVLAGSKLVRLFDPDQHSGKPDAGLKRLLGWLTFAPVLMLAIPGLVLARRDPSLRAWLAVLAGTVATAVVFYGDVRMRSPADPALLAFAAVALSAILLRLRGSHETPPAGR